MAGLNKGIVSFVEKIDLYNEVTKCIVMILMPVIISNVDLNLPITVGLSAVLVFCVPSADN
jgi:hypothetical protein